MSDVSSSSDSESEPGDINTMNVITDQDGLFDSYSLDFDGF